MFWRKDGTSFPVEYISTPMRDEAGALIGAVVTFRDISDRKWAETVLHRANEELEMKVRERTAELYAANERLRELSALKSRFVSMVCHEFGNPLNNIALSVSSLNRYDDQLSLVQKTQYLSDIEANVARMARMIDDILVLGKLEAKRLKLSPQPMDLVVFCRGLLAEVDPQGQQVRFMGRHKPLVAEIDQTLLRSILTNILSNALRYSAGHSRVYFSLAQKKESAVFVVRDEGLGIPSEDFPHLFEPFHRGRNVSNIPGTGLGLSIVKQFVEFQRGDVRVRSRLGEGTTFKVLLPLLSSVNCHR